MRLRDWLLIIAFWVIVFPFLAWVGIKAQPYLLEFVEYLANQFDAWLAKP